MEPTFIYDSVQMLRFRTINVLRVPRLKSVKNTVFYLTDISILAVNLERIFVENSVPNFYVFSYFPGCYIQPQPCR
jgi:hypothetical protein